MTTIPIDPKLFWGLFYFSCFGLAVVVAYGLLSTRQRSDKDPLDLLKSKFGATSVNDGLFLCAILLWAAIALSLTAGLFLMIWELIWYAALAAQGDGTNFRFALLRLTAFTATLGAVIALPFTVIRLKLTGEQTNTATESLFNDKINAATDDLHAMRQISKTTQDADGNEVTQTLWQDDITRRNAAIDRLEGLANERPDSAPRISRLLSVYVRELSREYPPFGMPDETEGRDPRDWAVELTARRSDMQNATQVLGRLRSIIPVDPETITIDLSDANLQGFYLSGLNLQEANFATAKMHGAQLSNAEMQRADFQYAELQFADLSGAQLQGAKLNNARMHGAYFLRTGMREADLSGAAVWSSLLREVNLQNAHLWGAQFQGASLNFVDLRGANLTRVNMTMVKLYSVEFDEKTDLTHVSFQGAAVREMDFTSAPQIEEFLGDIFGDGSVTLPPNVPWPAHWPRKILAGNELAFEMHDEFSLELRKWRGDRDNYVPPVLPDGPNIEVTKYR
ncbi:MAG: pentapeptide repeat-containing protein [Rhodobacteraceae bacterium]|nr:pentapeptide repeat-containing protein [Paracoccaceae bacterium]